jgi:hypothetical protein
MNQKLQDITTANQLRMAPVRVPDMKAIQAKASEYNNLDANTKKYLAARGIRNQADYVNNYVNSIQG